MNDAMTLAAQTIRRADTLDRAKEIYQKRTGVDPLEKLVTDRDRLFYSSYIANALSFVIACYAVIYFAGDFTGFQKWIMLGAGTSVLVGIEFLKRILNVQIAKGQYTFIIFLLVVTAASSTISYIGGEKFIVEERTEVTLPPPPEIASIEKEIAAIDEKIAGWKKQTWKGTIYRKAQAQIDVLNSQRDKLFNRRLALIEKTELKTDELRSVQKMRLANLGMVGGILAIAMDGILAILLFFVERKEKAIAYLYKNKVGKVNGEVNKVNGEVNKVNEQSVRAPVNEWVNEVNGEVNKVNGKVNGEVNGEVNGNARYRLSPQKRAKIIRLRKQGMGMNKIAQEVGCSPNTVFKLVSGK